jgi:hypothetical protein
MFDYHSFEQRRLSGAGGDAGSPDRRLDTGVQDHAVVEATLLAHGLLGDPKEHLLHDRGAVRGIQRGTRQGRSRSRPRV